ncbi:MAG: glycosyltransferase family 4 protein [Bacteroidota bacterium]
MRKVLVVAYYFPPMGLSGVQRTLKFVKYLPLYNWQPTVLTVTPGSYFARDASFLKQIEPLRVSVLRTDSIDPTRFFRKGNSDTGRVVKMPREWIRKSLNVASQFLFIPDNKIGWRRKACQTAAELLQREKFDLIFATAPPYTDFLIGRYLKKRFNLPLVLDYRDAWLDNPYHFYFTPIHRWIHHALEKGVLRASDKVITINRRIKELLLKRYPFLQYHDVEIISQGFDPSDFNLDGIEPLPRGKKMRLTYSGTFIDKRTPRFFLQALSKLFHEQPALREKIEAYFLGYFREENLKLVKKLGLQDVVKVLGYVEHNECVRNLVASDVLWLIIGKGAGEDMMSTGKLFEYLGARKPILGCVPDGVAKTTILDSGAGIVVEPDDVDAITSAIKTLYRQYESGTLVGPSEEYVEKFNRKRLTADLARTFELLVE